MKRILGYCVVIFSLISIGYALRDMTLSGGNVPVRQPEAEKNAEEHVAVILFRGSGFCPTCDIMEKLVKELFDGPLSADRAGKEVVFSRINLEERENEHYFFDYDLTTTSIVLSYVRDGREMRWKYLDKGWQLAEGNPTAFKRYVLDSVREFQQGGGNQR